MASAWQEIYILFSVFRPRGINSQGCEHSGKSTVSFEVGARERARVQLTLSVCLSCWRTDGRTVYLTSYHWSERLLRREKSEIKYAHLRRNIKQTKMCDAKEARHFDTMRRRGNIWTQQEDVEEPPDVYASQIWWMSKAMRMWWTGHVARVTRHTEFSSQKAISHEHKWSLRSARFTIFTTWLFIFIYNNCW
jgi:hypothetical protein